MVEQGMKSALTECPDPEVLAAYLAGRLPAAEKAAVTEHLADCADCYAVFIESARARSAGWWAWAEGIWGAIVEASGWSKAVVATAGLAAATASLTFLVQPQLVTRWWGGSELTELVAAVGTERTIEPRLTGGFAYGALVEQRRMRSGERVEDRLSPELRIAALTLEKRLQGDREPSTLAAYAAGQLVTGQVHRAVSAFEEAARLAPKNARVQNDLSAAYLVRFKQKHELEDVTKAVTAATKATDIDRSLGEARFNLALALEVLSKQNEARKAWEAYLETDSESAWADEARRHLAQLASDKQSRQSMRSLSPATEDQRGNGEATSVYNEGAPGMASNEAARGVPYPVLGDVDKPVLDWAVQATLKDPDSQSARFNRALPLEGLKRPDQARTAWQDYSQIDSFTPWADGVNLTAANGTRQDRSHSYAHCD